MKRKVTFISKKIYAEKSAEKLSQDKGFNYELIKNKYCYIFCKNCDERFMLLTELKKLGYNWVNTDPKEHLYLGSNECPYIVVYEDKKIGHEKSYYGEPEMIECSKLFNGVKI